MFCSKCGKGKQKAFSYCRACGEWLNDPDKPFSFANATGEEYIITVIIFNALSLITAVFIAFTLMNYFERSFLSVLLAALSIGLAGWQVSNSILTLSIRHYLKRRLFIRAQEKSKRLRANDQYLPPAKTNSIITPSMSVAENTTDLLDSISLKSKKEFSGELT